MTIQWFPGHMAKAKREIQAQLSQVDMIIEIADARVPQSSRNPQLAELSQKPQLLVLNKADLADPVQTKKWLAAYREQGQAALALDSQHGQPLRPVLKASEQLLAAKLAKQHERGVKQVTMRAICVGIPNSGKSTFLNRLVGRKIAASGDRPGVTKKQSWLKTAHNFEVLDTPGVLWPKFADPTVGQKLALTGAIRAGLYHDDDIALFALRFLRRYYPQPLQATYHLQARDHELNSVDLLLALTQKFGYRDDYDRFAQRILFDFRKGKLGRVTLDQLPKENIDHG